MTTCDVHYRSQVEQSSWAVEKPLNFVIAQQGLTRVQSPAEQDPVHCGAALSFVLTTPLDDTCTA